MILSEPRFQGHDINRRQTTQFMMQARRTLRTT